MGDFFTAVFYQPLLNFLVFIYNLLPNHDLGLAIIIFTIIVKLILAPFSYKQVKAQVALQELQPHINRLKEEHKEDQQAFAQAQIKLFQEKKINPLSSCLPVLVQLPFLFALFYIFSHGLKGDSFASQLYPFVANPGKLNESFLGIFSLTQNANIPLAIINAAMQFVQTKMLMPKKEKKAEDEKKKEPDMATMMSQQMLFIVPLATGYMSYHFASGLGLYYLVQTLFTIIQQKVFFAMIKKKEA